MVLPDWFPIEEFEYSTQEGSDYGCGTGDWSVTNFIRNGDANDNADFKIVTYEQEMPAYGCGYAKELGTSKGRTVQLLVGGVTAQGALGMSLGDYFAVRQRLIFEGLFARYPRDSNHLPRRSAVSLALTNGNIF